MNIKLNDIIIILIVFILNIICYYRGFKNGLLYGRNKTMDIILEALRIKLNNENKSEEEQYMFFDDLEDVIEENKKELFDSCL